MNRVNNFLWSFLSRDWAGLALAAIPASAGLLALLTLGKAQAAPLWVEWLGYAALGIAGLMALGSARHLLHMARVRKKYPPPGRLVDVGGYRLHLLAEGAARGKPPVVWMPGGHSSGFNLHHLHRMLREEARSILIDRPGTGWSDIGPFPRTTAGEALEVIAALEKSGETGPFVLAGHSFGGLLVANIARRRPDLVAGLVLLDPTPPDTIIYGPPVGTYMEQARRDMLKTAMSRLFGFHQDLSLTKLNDFNRGRVDNAKKHLGPAATAEQAIESGSRASLAGASIFEELTPAGMAEAAWENVVYDGELGDLPVFLVAPRGSSEGEFQQAWTILAKTAGLANSAGAGEDLVKLEARARNFYLRSRERYPAASSRSERIYTPAGTTHFLPWEVPEFVADVVRRMQQEPH